MGRALVPAEKCFAVAPKLDVKLAAESQKEQGGTMHAAALKGDTVHNSC